MAQKASTHMSEAKHVCPSVHGDLKWWQDPATVLEPATQPHVERVMGRMQEEGLEQGEALGALLRRILGPGRVAVGGRGRTEEGLGEVAGRVPLRLSGRRRWR